MEYLRRKQRSEQAGREDNNKKAENKKIKRKRPMSDQMNPIIMNKQNNQNRQSGYRKKTQQK